MILSAQNGVCYATLALQDPAWSDNPAPLKMEGSRRLDRFSGGQQAQKTRLKTCFFIRQARQASDKAPTSASAFPRVETVIDMD